MKPTDNLMLDSLEPGSEVVSVFKRDGKTKYGAVCVVTGFDEKLKRWRYTRPENPDRCVGAFPPDGGCRMFMSKRTTPDYFMSANPEHIQLAKKQAERARKEYEKKATEKERRMNLARPIGELLGYSDYDPFGGDKIDNTDDVAETLIERLSDEQIEVLKTWLGITRSIT